MVTYIIRKCHISYFILHFIHKILTQITYLLQLEFKFSNLEISMNLPIVDKNISIEKTGFHHQVLFRKFSNLASISNTSFSRKNCLQNKDLLQP